MKRLGDVTEMLVGFAFKSAGFLDADAEGVRLLRGDNVQQGYLRWGDKTKKWPAADYDDLGRYQLAEGDVILAMDRPIVGNGLKMAWIKAEDLPALLVQRVCRLRGKPGVALTGFIRYVLAAPEFSAHIHRVTTGANIPHISGKDIAAYEFPLPEPDDQARIVECLSAYDELIATNQRRIALLEDAARRLYHEWFVQLRFPGHESVPVQDGMPEGWMRDTLDKALFLQRGFDLPNGNRVSGEVPVYASTGINGYHNVAKVDGPGVVTGRSGTLGAVHYVAQDFWPLNTSLWVKEFRAISPLVAYFMLAELGLEQLNSGASVPTLDRKVVHQIPVLIPARNVVAEFDVKAQSLFDQIQVLEKTNENTAKARDLLLPKLMSGQLDVSGIPLPDEVAA
ncbi:restriction endonuclease subunit S [Geopseudomonas aromaticivorans]